MRTPRGWKSAAVREITLRLAILLSLEARTQFQGQSSGLCDQILLYGHIFPSFFAIARLFDSPERGLCT
jgi:hypothetical protein